MSTDVEILDDRFISLSLEKPPTATDPNGEKQHSSSEESDEDVKVVSEQQRVSQRRRVQNATFEALLVFISCVTATS